MCTHGLLIPGSEASRFCFSSTVSSPTVTYKSDPFFRFKPLTRFSHGSFKIKAAVQEGIPTNMSFYELLGIPESGTLIEIKQAYKKVARKYHPDVSPPDRVEEYTQRFIRVQEAYETLSDPRRRALYDRDMARGLHLAFSARRRHQNDEAKLVESGDFYFVGCQLVEAENSDSDFLKVHFFVTFPQQP
ncbi:hypothetical protein GH714_022764 [Hevea brasiliensis]|uniref:J domain-containing protein n=1 Tax=Hevea brasiliensis TaxID=3981 RepID=A0A6A6KKC9_HEVBR|nr:hypothetical protein GH714_022764 [Hevea brasiliensis]